MADNQISFYVVPLGFTCPCGNHPNGVSLGLTSLGSLRVSWNCGACHNDAFVNLPLEELIENVPEPPSVPSASEPLAFDKGFMEEAHIRFLEEEDDAA